MKKENTTRAKRFESTAYCKSGMDQFCKKANTHSALALGLGLLDRKIPLIAGTYHTLADAEYSVHLR